MTDNFFKRLPSKGLILPNSVDANIIQSMSIHITSLPEQKSVIVDITGLPSEHFGDDKIYVNIPSIAIGTIIRAAFLASGSLNKSIKPDIIIRVSSQNRPVDDTNIVGTNKWQKQ